jgi:hypothetical protein
VVGNQTMASTSNNNSALPPRMAATPDDARSEVPSPQAQRMEMSSFKQHFGG